MHNLRQKTVLRLDLLTFFSEQLLHNRKNPQNPDVMYSGKFLKRNKSYMRNSWRAKLCCITHLLCNTMKAGVDFQSHEAITRRAKLPTWTSNFQYLRMTEWVRLAGTTADHLVQPPCSSRVIPENTAQDCIQTGLEYPQ